MSDDLSMNDPLLEEISQCRQCKLTSTLPELFHRRLCPRCLGKNAVRNGKLIYLAILIIFVGDLIVNGVCVDISGRLPQIWMVMSVLSLFFIFCHELCHALAAKLLGGTIFAVEIGSGNELFSYSFENILLRIRFIPSQGLCYAGFTQEKYLRLRYGLYISAGLAFHAAMIVITAAALATVDNQSWQVIDLLRVVLFLNTMYLLFNLIPRKVTTAIGRANNDGKQLLNLIRGEMGPAKISKNFYVMDALFSYQRNDMESMRRAVSIGMEKLPNNEMIRNLNLFLLLNDRKVNEARLGWKRIIENDLDDIENRMMHAVMYNNLGWAELLADLEPNSQALANEYAKRAYSMTPWMAEMAGTYAATSTLTGEYAQGIRLAEEASSELQRLKPPRWEETAATHMATLALANFRQHNQHEAQRFLAQAVAQSKDDLWVERVSAEMNPQHR